MKVKIFLCLLACIAIGSFLSWAILHKFAFGLDMSISAFFTGIFLVALDIVSEKDLPEHMLPVDFALEVPAPSEGIFIGTVLIGIGMVTGIIYLHP